jgi:hypothetical protein
MKWLIGLSIFTLGMLLAMCLTSCMAPAPSCYSLCQTKADPVLCTQDCQQARAQWQQGMQVQQAQFQQSLRDLQSLYNPPRTSVICTTVGISTYCQ